MRDVADGRKHGWFQFPDEVLSESDVNGQPYVQVRLEYDHERTFYTWQKSVKAIENARGPFERTTPGVRPRWTIPADVEFRSVTTQPGDQRVYVGAKSGEVLAIDTDTGTVQWRTADACEMYPSLTVSGETLYTASRDTRLYALDATTGGVEWRVETGGKIRSSPLVLATTESDVSTYPRRLVCIGSRDGAVYAIEEDGTIRWTYDTGARILLSPVAFEGTVYAGNNDGTVCALDATSGTVEWTADTGERIHDMATVPEGTIFAGANKDGLYALDAKTGAEQWRYSGKARTLVTDDERVYSDGGYALDAETGDLEQEYERVGLDISVTDETLYSPGRHSPSAAYDIETGRLRWRYQGGRSRVSAAQGDTVFTAGEGGVTALETTGSTRVRFAGVLDRFEGGHGSLARIVSVEDNDASAIVYPRQYIPYYGYVHNAHFDVFVALDTDYEPVTGERQRESRQITEFDAAVADSDDAVVTLTLTDPDADIRSTTLCLHRESLPADLRAPGDTGYASVFIEVDWDGTPDEAKPEQYCAPDDPMQAAAEKFN